MPLDVNIKTISWRSGGGERKTSKRGFATGVSELAVGFETHSARSIMIPGR